MSRFSHLILTPFNVRTFGAPGLDEAWLTHRFRLFEDFCYPSVKAQTCQDFRWLVFMDVETPEPFRRRIEALRSYPNLEPIYIRQIPDFKQPTLERIDPGATHLITTTLDNDDAVATALVERVQAEFREQDFQFVNFVSGFRLDLPGRKLYAHRIRANPFITLIERNEDVKTMHGCGAHNLLLSKYADAIRDVETDPLWLQVVHGRNIAITGMWGCRRVPLTALDGRFALGWDARVAAEAALPIRIENLRRSAERLFIHLLGRPGAAVARRVLKAIRRLRSGR